RKTRDEPFINIQDGGATQADINGKTYRVGGNYDQSESDRVLQFCKDQDAGGAATVDQFPSIRNCRVQNYFFGGAGIIDTTLEKRMPATLPLTRGGRALGHPELKVGVDVEVTQTAAQRLRSGGSPPRLFGSYWRPRQFGRPDPNGPDVCTESVDAQG